MDLTGGWVDKALGRKIDEKTLPNEKISPKDGALDVGNPECLGDGVALGVSRSPGLRSGRPGANGSYFMGQLPPRQL